MATSPMATFEARSASKRKLCSARHERGQHDLRHGVQLGHRERPHRHRLTHQPGQHEAGDDHDVARNDEDDQRDRQCAGNAERNVDRHDQRLVSQRIDERAELAGHVEALGDEAVDRIADPGRQKQKEGGPHLPRHDRPDHDRDQHDASQCNEVWNTQTCAPARKSPYIAGRRRLRTRRFQRRRRRAAQPRLGRVIRELVNP